MANITGSRSLLPVIKSALVLPSCLAALLYGTWATADALVYEDAESGDASRWSVYDDDPPGASVTTVFDAELGSRVIEFAGEGVSNGYLLGGRSTRDGGGNDTSRFIVSWNLRVRSGERFSVYVAADTANGSRYFQYTMGGTDRGFYNGRYIHHALDASVGSWNFFTRDLVADLADAEPGNELLAVHGFLVRGNVRIDDIILSDLPWCN